LKLTSDKLLVIGVSIAIIGAFFYMPWEDSYFGLILDGITEPEWTEILPRNVVKNSIIFEIINDENGQCLSTADRLDGIVDHAYFVRADEFIKDIKYDRDAETMIIQCNKIPDNQARLHIWYVLEEAPKDSTKYKYFITESDILTNQIEP